LFSVLGFFFVNSSEEHCASEYITYCDHLSDMVICVFCLALVQERLNYPARFSCLFHTGINEADSSLGRTSSKKGVSANFSFIQPPSFCLLKMSELEELLKIRYLIYWKDDITVKQTSNTLHLKRCLEVKIDLCPELEGYITQHNMKKTLQC